MTRGRGPARLRRGRRPALAALVAAALAGSLAGGAALAETDASGGFYEKAEGHLARHEWQAALIELKNALRADPDNAAARFELGRLYLQLGDAASAEIELRAARERGFDAARLAEPLARALLGQGKYEAILQEDASAGHQVLPLVWRAYALLGLRRAAEAQQAALEAVAADPKEPRAHAALSYVLFSEGRLAEAEAQVDQALALAPAMAEALTLKGELRRIAKDQPAALRAFTQALEAEPGALLARAGRVGVMIELGELDKAQQDLDVLRGARPDLIIAVYLQAVVLASRHDLPGAIDLLARYGRALDAYPAAVKLLGGLYLARGELEQAQTYLSRYLGMAGDDLPVREQLAGVMLRKGQAASAIELLLPPAQASSDARLLGLLATAYLGDRQPAEAARWFDRAAAAAPADADLRTRIAVGRLQAGQVEIGLKELEQVVELDPQQTAGHIALALADLRAGRFDAAAAAAEQLRSRAPDSPVPDHILGTILLYKGDTAGARAHFEAALRLSPGFLASADQLARLDLAAGDSARARDRYEAMLRTDPAAAGPALELARIALADGKPDEAEALLGRVGDGEALAPRLAVVELYLQQHDIEKALPAAQKLRDAAPGNVDAADALARAQLAAGQGPQAVATLRQAADAAPGSARPQQLLARALLATGDAAGARAALETALRIDESDLPAAIDLIDLEAAAGRPDAARAVAEAWRARHPDAASADILLGEALARTGHLADAIEAYGRAFQRQPTTDAALRWYGALLAGGQADKALAGLRAWADQHPAERAPALALAAALIQARRYDEAEARYQRLLDASPNDPVLLNNLAWLCDLRGDARAEALAERAYRLAPASPEIADTLGFILTRRSDAQRGLQLLRQAQAASNTPEIAYHLAVALDRAGQPAEARALLDRLLASAAAFDGRPDAVILQQKLASR
jgi:putative PEP-CTERM system TPR-repeat lipoprotein